MHLLEKRKKPLGTGHHLKDLGKKIERTVGVKIRRGNPGHERKENPTKIPMEKSKRKKKKSAKVGDWSRSMGIRKQAKKRTKKTERKS